MTGTERSGAEYVDRSIPLLGIIFQQIRMNAEPSTQNPGDFLPHTGTHLLERGSGDRYRQGGNGSMAQAGEDLPRRPGAQGVAWISRDPWDCIVDFETVISLAGPCHLLGGRAGQKHLQELFFEKFFSCFSSHLQLGQTFSNSQNFNTIF